MWTKNKHKQKKSESDMEKSQRANKLSLMLPLKTGGIITQIV